MAGPSKARGVTTHVALCAWTVLLAVGVFEACESTASDRPVGVEDAGQGDVSVEAPGTGGQGGSGGTAGAAGGGGAAGADCMAGAVEIDPALFAECPSCSGARCVPVAAVDATGYSSQLADCPNGDKCVPDSFVATYGRFIAKSCRSLADAEGRCLSTCLPQIQEQAARLPRSVCAEDEVCAPCFDPTTGSNTGACDISCDPGPSEPKKVFEQCCGGLGSCVPASVVPSFEANLLSVDTCTKPDTLCAPTNLISPSAVPTSCRSVGDSEGRCIPSCLPAIQAQANLLPQGSCADGMLCAPCFDPRTADPTGACSVNDDEPKEDPYVFPTCCGGDGSPDLGTCVPISAIPSNLAALLSQDTCPESDAVCAPTLKVMDLSAKFTPCTTTAFCEDDGGCWPGACIPACLLPEEYRGAPRQTCDEGEVCAPCQHPLLDGAPTGACD